MDDCGVSSLEVFSLSHRQRGRSSFLIGYHCTNRHDGHDLQAQINESLEEENISVVKIVE
jgi:hypothetical protein